MSWVTMRDRDTGDLFEDQDYDAFQSNIEYRLSPNSGSDELTSSFTTTSTDYVDTGLEVIVTTYGGLVSVHADILAYRYNVSDFGYIQIDIDSTTQVEQTASNATSTYNQYISRSLHWEGILTAGSHTIKIQAKRNSGVSTNDFTIFADSRLWVKES